MIAVRSWSANPFGEVQSHYVIRVSRCAKARLPVQWVQTSASASRMARVSGRALPGVRQATRPGSAVRLGAATHDDPQQRRGRPAIGHWGKAALGPCYLSGESISTVTLTSRILASTLPRSPGGTSS